MRILKPDQVAALFDAENVSLSASKLPEYSIGNVFCLYRNAECVPIRYRDSRFMLEFTIPYYLTQVTFWDEILLKTQSGGHFIPKLEHRYLNIGRIDKDGDVIGLCDVSPSELPHDKAAFAEAIRQALLTYYRSYPNANQYFYIQEQPMVKAILEIIFNQMPAEILDRYHITYHPELAEPLAGFTLTSKAL